MKHTARRLIAYMMTFTVLLSMLVTYGTLTASAESTAVTDSIISPSDIPSETYETLEEYGFSIEDIREDLLKEAAHTFVDGKLRVKSIGEVDFSFYDQHYEERNAELIDGYYYIDITEEEYAQGFSAYHYGPDYAWTIDFEGSLSRAIITLNSTDEDTDWSIESYPEDGWSGKVEISYDIYGGVTVENSYIGGVITEHTLKKTVMEGVDLHVTYLIDGTLISAAALAYNEWYYYNPHDGWEEVPPGFEDMDEAYLTETLPSVLHCTHEFQAPDCYRPECCTHCSEIKSGALGHVWKSADGKDVCTVCEAKRLTSFVVPEASFDGVAPKKNLKDVTLPIEEIRQLLPLEMEVSYADGHLTLTTWESASVYALVGDSYRDPSYSEDGQCIFDVSETERETMSIQICVKTDNNNRLDVEYDGYGKLTGAYELSYGETNEDGEYIKHGYVNENTAFGVTTVCYYDDPENTTYAYRDVYKNGLFCEREITYYYNDEDEMELEVRYDARGDIIYIEAEVDDNNVYYNLEHECWSTGRNYYSPTAAPKMAVGKTVEELLAVCPSGLDFLSAGAQDGNGGEQAGGEPCGVLGIILTAGGALLLACGALVGGYLFGKKKKEVGW